ncbi:MAG: 2-dehydropantoate 2-reductase [Bacilli bacterium]|nr:2-dehydropantoate 2-reductase [Bacilli bacterium]
MRLAIYGAGAMGTVLGAYLAKAGIEIDLITRNTEHIAALKKDGAHIIGKVDFWQEVNALLPEEMEGKYDIIFLITKQLDNRSIVKGLKEHLQDDGVICTMQNGLPELSVSEIVGEERTAGCAMAWGATMHGHGVSELTTEPARETLTFSLGSFGNIKQDKISTIRDLLSIMGNVTVEPNFIGARWAKLLVNSAFSGLSAILGETFGAIAKNRKSRLIAQKIMKECIDVAKVANIKIEPIQGKDVVKLLDYKSRVKQQLSFMIIPIAMKKHKDLKSSMLQDLLKGKKCEIEAINGVVSAYGRRHSWPTPFNDRIVEVVREIESGERKPSWKNLERFDEFVSKKNLS